VKKSHDEEIRGHTEFDFRWGWNEVLSLDNILLLQVFLTIRGSSKRAVIAPSAAPLKGAWTSEEKTGQFTNSSDTEVIIRHAKRRPGDLK